MISRRGRIQPHRCMHAQIPVICFDIFSCNYTYMTKCILRDVPSANKGEHFWEKNGRALNPYIKFYF